MSEKRLTLTYNLDGQPVEITVTRATARTGVRRYQMMVDAEEANKNETDEALKPLRFISYPDAMCSTVEVTGLPWPMDFDTFADLDEDLVNRWMDAVYKINPHWRGGDVDKETAEKKG